MLFQACLAVVQYVGSMVERIRDSLDGKNVESLMMELGVRFHRVIFEHLQQFQYNSAGNLTLSITLFYYLEINCFSCLSHFVKLFIRM
jgi:Exocyst complex component Sec10.